jgi:hypothetical protein
MARIRSVIKISGKVGNIVFTTKHGKCFARPIDPTLSERVKQDPEYEQFRKSGIKFGLASKMASGIYAGARASGNRRVTFGRVTKEVYRLMREGMEEAEIVRLLTVQFYFEE